jgi:uncharacterized protein (DUF1810 family)
MITNKHFLKSNQEERKVIECGIFSQYKGLGFSETLKHYLIQDLNEAMDYLNHAILGSRLKDITNELLLFDENNVN